MFYEFDKIVINDFSTIVHCSKILATCWLFNGRRKTMKPYESLNYLQEDNLLTSEEIMIRDTVREFVSDEVVPVLQQANRDEKFPMQLIPRFAEMGFLGSTIQGYGCAGLGHVAYGLVIQELERGDSGSRSFCSVQSSLVMYPIYTYGSEAQKEKYLPELASAKKVGCFGLTEPDAGSNPGGMRTKAEKFPAAISSMATKCGSRTAVFPISRSCGRNSTAKSAALSLKKAPKVFDQHDERQVLVARERDLGVTLSRLRCSGRKYAAESSRIKRSVELSDASPLRYCVGSVRSSERMLPNGSQYAKERTIFDGKLCPIISSPKRNWSRWRKKSPKVSYWLCKPDVSKKPDASSRITSR